VAVIDTGWLPHRALVTQTLPGYDFVSDPTKARDGDGRDDNPTDMGDYGGGCVSTWHGTSVAAIIARRSDMALLPYAGVAFRSKILPVRVIAGPCGTLTRRDLIDAITWSSGGSVAGVPPNLNPAKVINMSLVALEEGPCPTDIQAAISSAKARGSVLVTAAGNSGRAASEFGLANCNDVLAVAATDRDRKKAFFSNFGNQPYVDLAAPGDGIRAPVDESTSSPSFEYRDIPLLGTSYAAPQVSAVAALLFSMQPSLSPALVERILTSSAQPISATDCPGGCGAGLLDAAGAVRKMTGLQTETNGLYETHRRVEIADRIITNSTITVTTRPPVSRSATLQKVRVDIKHPNPNDLSVSLSMQGHGEYKVFQLRALTPPKANLPIDYALLTPITLDDIHKAESWTLRVRNLNSTTIYPLSAIDGWNLWV
jgi:serine protease